MPTPEELIQAAMNAQEAAEQSANNAATSESNAATSATKAKNEVGKPKQIAWLTFWVTVFTFIAIATQSVLTKSSVDLAREEIGQSKKQIRTYFLQQKKADQEQLLARLNDTFAFAKLHALDSGCAGTSRLTPSEQISVSTLVQQVLLHYQYYYSVTSELGLRSDWKNICETAKQHMTTFCHLERRLWPLMDRGTQEFREAFEKCELSTK